MMIAQNKVGDVLPNGATVVSVDLTEQEGVTTEHVVAEYPSGAKDHEVIRTPGPGTVEDNQRLVEAKLRAAMVDNVTWLMAKGSTEEQVERLTRQVNGLLRYVLGHFDDAAGI